MAINNLDCPQVGESREFHSDISECQKDCWEVYKDLAVWTNYIWKALSITVNARVI
jgi:hypothetical protein